MLENGILQAFVQMVNLLMKQNVMPIMENGSGIVVEVVSVIYLLWDLIQQVKIIQLVIC